jgi:hypothetical protein
MHLSLKTDTSRVYTFKIEKARIYTFKTEKRMYF